MGIATERIKEQFPDLVLDHHENCGDETIVIKKDGLMNVARFIRTDPELSFEVLLDLAAVDYLGRYPRFEMVYHFYSMSRKSRLRIKLPVSEDIPEVDSLTSIWKGADWQEREAWDMFGIQFRGHPDLKRILMYDEFEGHPLRKDYPITRRQPRIGPLN